MSAEVSPAQRAMYELALALGPLAHEVLDIILDKMEFEELVALACDWRGFWARPKQIPPADFDSWGFLGARGLGKTVAGANAVNDAVNDGTARSICLIAQDESNSVKIQVLGPSGLIATAKPDRKPTWEASALELVWPNGARAYVRTPEVPGKIRGFDYDLAWPIEIQSWPVKTRDEAFANLLIATRIGLARIIWDATPKRRHPILKKLLADGERDPGRNVVVRGSTAENASNLGARYMARLELEMGGTQRGREELLGEMLEDSETALVKQEWIDEQRRELPSRLVRRVIAVDPAITDRQSSDQTGIVDVGLAPDQQAIVLGDYTGKYDPPTWANIVIDKYLEGRCDLVIVETNKGGQLLVTNLRAAAKERGLRVVVVDAKWRSRGHLPGTMHVREVYGRGSKEDRAQPLATAYERGRVSHVRSADLAALEDTLTTWEPIPGHRSPDRLDPLVYGIIEVLGLSSNVPPGKSAFAGVAEANRTLAGAAMGDAAAIAARLRGRGGDGGRI